MKLKLTKKIIDNIRTYQFDGKYDDIILDLFNSKEKKVSNNLLKTIGKINFDGQTIDDYLSNMGVDTNESEAREIKLSTFIGKLKDMVTENDKNKNEPEYVTTKIKFNGKNFKKPSFSIFKSFFRLFNKNWWREEHNAYLNDLAIYNSAKESAEKNKGFVIQESPNPKAYKEELELDIPDLKEEVPSKSIKNVAPEIVFNYPYVAHLRLKGNNEDVHDYADEIMRSRCGLPLNEHNAELIVLSSFNLNELFETQDFIESNENLSYLKTAIDYKINALLDNEITTIRLTDSTAQVRKNAQFISQTINAGFLDDLNAAIENDVSPYEALSSQPNIFVNDHHSNKSKQSRELAKQKITDNNVLATTSRNIKIKEDKNSVLLTNVPKTEMQSTGCGCWSCSLNVLLKCQNVNNINQEEIRGFRPEFNKNNTEGLNPLVTLKERINFTKRVSNDVFNEINDYTDIIHKTIKNAAFKSKQISGSPKYVYDEVKKILKEKKTPVSFLYCGHYRTVIGVDKGRFIFEDSNVFRDQDIYHRNGNKIDTEMASKYPQNCTQTYTSFSPNSPIVISWIEKIEEPDPKKYIDDNLKGMDKVSHAFRSEGTTFSKNQFDSNSNAFIIEDIVLPNNYLSLEKEKKSNVVFDDDVSEKSSNDSFVNINKIDENLYQIVDNEINK